VLRVTGTMAPPETMDPEQKIVPLWTAVATTGTGMPAPPIGPGSPQARPGVLDVIEEQDGPADTARPIRRTLWRLP
jgi:hypothetical protein